MSPPSKWLVKNIRTLWKFYRKSYSPTGKETTRLYLINSLIGIKKEKGPWIKLTVVWSYITLTLKVKWYRQNNCYALIENRFTLWYSDPLHAKIGRRSALYTIIYPLTGIFCLICDTWRCTRFRANDISMPTFYRRLIPTDLSVLIHFSPRYIKEKKLLVIYSFVYLISAACLHFALMWTISKGYSWG